MLAGRLAARSANSSRLSDGVAAVTERCRGDRSMRAAPTAPTCRRGRAVSTSDHRLRRPSARGSDRARGRDIVSTPTIPCDTPPASSIRSHRRCHRVGRPAPALTTFDRYDDRGRDAHRVPAPHVIRLADASPPVTTASARQRRRAIRFARTLGRAISTQPVSGDPRRIDRQRDARSRPGSCRRRSANACFLIGDCTMARPAAVPDDAARHHRRARRTGRCCRPRAASRRRAGTARPARRRAAARPRRGTGSGSRTRTRRPVRILRISS